MRYSDYKCFRFGFDSGVALVSIDHPPINLLDEVLSQEFDKLGKSTTRPLTSAIYTLLGEARQRPLWIERLDPKFVTTENQLGG
jgi:hypothetical protein